MSDTLRSRFFEMLRSSEEKPNPDKNKKLFEYKPDLEDMRKIVEFNIENRRPDIYDCDDNGHLQIHSNLVELRNKIDDCLNLIEYYQKPIKVEGEIVEIDGELKIDDGERYHGIYDEDLIEYLTTESISGMKKWLSAYIKIEDWRNDDGTYYKSYKLIDNGIHNSLKVGDRVRLRGDFKKKVY